MAHHSVILFTLDWIPVDVWVTGRPSTNRGGAECFGVIYADAAAAAGNELFKLFTYEYWPPD